MSNPDGLDEYRQEIREELEEHRGDVQEQMRKMRLQQQEVLDKMDEVLVAVGKTEDILTAWNNAKGFVNTVQTISKVIKFLTPIALLFGLVWYFVTHGELPPTK
jgi:hypothetical protein